MKGNILNSSWSSKKPVESGWYWCRQPQGSAFIIQIKDDEIAADGYEWAGPLCPPAN